MKNLFKNSPRRLAQLSCITLCGLGIATAASGAVVPLEAGLKQILLERAYDRSVETKTPHKPWVWADMAAVGKITHPRLGQSAIILSAGSKEAMRAGPTLMPGSADIGTAGASVIAAHRDTHFAFLKDVKIGDVMLASGKDGKMRNYRVTHLQIVHADKFAITAGLPENTLALSTCYPFGSVRGGKMRYVVHAIEFEGQASENLPEKGLQSAI
ncbi:MAG: sortase [Sphingorhabdus sp.]